MQIYQVDGAVKTLTRQILLAYALVAPLKVLNMILGGGILRSGGRTKYVMGIDLFGTWCLGVPLGLLSAFVLKLPIPWGSMWKRAHRLRALSPEPAASAGARQAQGDPAVPFFFFSRKIGKTHLDKANPGR